MRSLAVLLLAASALFAPNAMAQEPYVVPSPGIGGNRTDDAAIWHILGLRPGETLNIWSGPGNTFRIIGVLEEGTPVRNLGCRERDGGYWCRVSTYDRPRISGWVNGRFVSDEYAEPPGDYAPPVIRGRYDEEGDFNCRFGSDPRLYRCPFGLQRQGTSAMIDIQTPDGQVRQLAYRAGRFKATDGAEVRSRKNGSEAVVMIDGFEIYHIPDNVVLDW